MLHFLPVSPDGLCLLNLWASFCNLCTLPRGFSLAEESVFIGMVPTSLACYSYTSTGKNICHLHFLQFCKGNKPTQTETGLFSPLRLRRLQFLYYLQTWKVHFMDLWFLHIALFTTMVLRLTLEEFFIWFFLPFWEVSICGLFVFPKIKLSKYSLIHLLSSATLEYCPMYSGQSTTESLHIVLWM